MLKKIKGFTLVELIIAISLLASIGLLIGLNFNKIFNKEEKSNYDEFVNKIKSASDVYLNSNNNILTELNTNRGFIEIKIKDLKEAGLISDDLIDPKTGEVLSDDKIVLVSLDEAGTVMFTYPAEEKEEHLQTLNHTLDYGSNFDCLIGLDYINLGLIGKDGYLVPNYFTNNLDNITCKTEVDTKVIGSHIVKYSYINQAGVTKEATRNFIVIDHIFPSVNNISYTPTTWTKDNVTISAEINDLESGIDAYAISLDKCENFIKTTNNNISGEASENGEYSVCAKDRYGNVTEENITITNIDKTPPIISDINKSTDEWVTSLTISTNIIDNQSKIVAYAINQTSSASDVSWTNITETTTQNVSYTVSANGTYYIWAKDKVGNINSKSIVINNIGTLRTITFTTSELSSQDYNGFYNTGYTVKAVQSITVDNGSAPTYSISGSIINYFLDEGTKNNSSRLTTCSYAAYYASPVYDEVCISYSCPSGGYLSGIICTGSNMDCVGYNYYICKNGSWAANGWTDNCSSNAPMGYSYSYHGCDAAPSGSCISGDTADVKCRGTYIWPGNYNATCTATTGGYSCPYGYYPSGAGCYKCDSDHTRSGSICNYDCLEDYDYYIYEVTIEYIT